MYGRIFRRGRRHQDLQDEEEASRRQINRRRRINLWSHIERYIYGRGKPLNMDEREYSGWPLSHRPGK